MQRIIEMLHQRELRLIIDACCGHRKGGIFRDTSVHVLVLEGVLCHLGVLPGESSSQEALWRRDGPQLHEPHFP